MGGELDLVKVVAAVALEAVPHMGFCSGVSASVVFCDVVNHLRCRPSRLVVVGSAPPRIYAREVLMNSTEDHVVDGFPALV